MGSANDKIIYLNSTKELIKNKINDLGGELDSQDPFREYSNSLDIIYEEYPKINDTNENITLQNTNAGKMEIELNSTELTQDGTPNPESPIDVNVITGSNNVKMQNKNLFNKNNIVYINNKMLNDSGAEISDSTGGYTKMYIQIKANTEYTISGLSNIGGKRIYYFDENKMFISRSTSYSQVSTITFTTPSNAKYIDIQYYINGNDFNNWQIEQGSSATEYIEHEEQNYPITLSSKNLFNINGDVNTRYNGQTGNYNSVENNNLTTTYSTNNGYPYGQRIYVGTGKKVTISGIVTDINTTGSKSALIMCFNDNTATGTQIVAFDATEINTRKSFSFTPNTDYIIVAFAGRYTGFVSATFTDIQVEYGETATTYMPYIANPIEYCKIGDYADHLFKNTIDSEFYDSTLLENEWYLKKNILKVTFDGSETNWLKDGNSYKINQSDMLTANVGKGLCNYFKNSRIDYSYTAGHVRFGWSNTYIYFYVDIENIADVNAWKDWLSTHNTKVYYQLATPTYIHISETDYPILKTQLDNLYNNAQSYNEETNIIQINDDLSFIIKAIALMGGDE